MYRSLRVFSSPKCHVNSQLISQPYFASLGSVSNCSCPQDVDYNRRHYFLLPESPLIEEVVFNRVRGDGLRRAYMIGQPTGVDASDFEIEMKRIFPS